MLNEVKIFDPNGKCKQILSGKKLSKAYWRKLYSSQTSCTPMKFGKGKKLNKNQLLNDFDYYSDDPFENYALEE